MLGPPPRSIPLTVPPPHSRFSHNAAHWIIGLCLFLYALLAALLQADSATPVPAAEFAGGILDFDFAAPSLVMGILALTAAVDAFLTDDKQLIARFSTCINFMSFVQYFLMYEQSFTVRKDSFARQMFIIRWIAWFFTTAIVILMIANLSTLGRRRIFFYAACQSACMLFAFMWLLIPNPIKWFFLVCCSFAWLVVVHGQYLIFRSIRYQWKGAKDYRLSTLLLLTQLWTHLLWLTLPLIIALATSDLITTDGEQWAFFACDIASKAVLCASLRAFADRQQWIYAVAVRERETQYKLFAEDANRRKREFLRYVFHEVRVPLQAFALGVTDLLDSFQMAEQQLPKEGGPTNRGGATSRPLGLIASPPQAAKSTAVSTNNNNTNNNTMKKRRPDSAQRKRRNDDPPSTSGGGAIIPSSQPAVTNSAAMGPSNTVATTVTVTSVGPTLLKHMPSLRGSAAMAAAVAAANNNNNNNSSNATSGTTSTGGYHRIDDNTVTAMTTSGIGSVMVNDSKRSSATTASAAVTAATASSTTPLMMMEGLPGTVSSSCDDSAAESPSPAFMINGSGNNGNNNGTVNGVPHAIAMRVAAAEATVAAQQTRFATPPPPADIVGYRAPVNSSSVSGAGSGSGTATTESPVSTTGGMSTPTTGVPGLILSSAQSTQPGTPASTLTVVAGSTGSSTSSLPVPALSPTSARRPRSSHATTAHTNNATASSTGNNNNNNNTMVATPRTVPMPLAAAATAASNLVTMLSVPEPEPQVLSSRTAAANGLNATTAALVSFFQEHPTFVTESLATINLLHDSTNYMSQLLDDVLTSQKIEDGQFTLNKAPFNIQSLARSTVALMKTWLKDKGIKIEFHIDETIPTIFGDKYRIRQVIANFLSNALKFSHHGGTIEVHVETLPGPNPLSPRITPPGAAGGGHGNASTGVLGTPSVPSRHNTNVNNNGTGNNGHSSPRQHSRTSRHGTASRKGDKDNHSERPGTASPRPVVTLGSGGHGHPGTQSVMGGIDVNAVMTLPQSVVYLRVGVRDHGVGMSDQDQKDLFRPYYQVLGGAAQKGKGTGLGLSICKNLITLCDGVIGVKAKQDQGSFFYFDVPFPVVRDMENEEPSVSGSAVYEASKRNTRAASPPPVAFVASPNHHNGGNAIERGGTPVAMNNNNHYPHPTVMANNGNGNGNGNNSNNNTNNTNSSPSSRSNAYNNTTLNASNNANSTAPTASSRTRTSAFTFVTGPPVPTTLPSAIQPSSNNNSNAASSQANAPHVLATAQSASSLLFMPQNSSTSHSHGGHVPPSSHHNHHHPTVSHSGSSQLLVGTAASMVTPPSPAMPAIGTTLSSHPPGTNSNGDFAQSQFVTSLAAIPATSSISVTSLSPNGQPPFLGRPQSWTTSATSPHGSAGATTAPVSLSAVIARGHHPSQSSALYLLPPSGPPSVAPTASPPSHFTSLASSTASGPTGSMYTSMSLSPTPAGILNSPGSVTSTLNGYVAIPIHGNGHSGNLPPASPGGPPSSMVMTTPPPSHHHSLSMMSRSSSPHGRSGLGSPPPPLVNGQLQPQPSQPQQPAHHHSRGGSKDFDSPNGGTGGRRPLITTLPGGGTSMVAANSRERERERGDSISMGGGGGGQNLSGISSDSPVAATVGLASGIGGRHDSHGSHSSLTGGIAPAKRRLKVLVVDDVSSNRRLLAKLLERRHVDCVQAENGRLALDLVLENVASFDAVLLDQEMPVMDGPSCCRALREAGLKMTILGLTGHTDTHEVWHAAGANAVLTKPANIDHVMSYLMPSSHHSHDR